jgi:hypothetical protein
VKLDQARTGDAGGFLDRFSPFPLFAKIIEKNIDFVAEMRLQSKLTRQFKKPTFAIWRSRWYGGVFCDKRYQCRRTPLQDAFERRRSAPFG